MKDYLANKLYSLSNWKFFPFLMAIIISLSIFLLALILRGTGTLQPLELSAYDIILSNKDKRPVDSRITMIWLTDADQRKWGWPIEDQQLNLLFEKLLKHDPAVIGLDLYRDLPVPLTKTPHYATLLETFQKNKNIIAIQKLSDDNGARVDPPEVLKNTQQVSFNDVPADINGIIRRGLLYAGNGGEVHEYFGLKLATNYLYKFHKIYAQQSTRYPTGIKLGQIELNPLDSHFGGYVNTDSAGFQFMIDYQQAPQKFANFDLTTVLTEDIPEHLIKDKIVIIGVHAEATPDFFYTPFGQWSDLDSRTPGARLHGYTTSQLIRMALGESEPFYSLSEQQEVLWILLWSFLGAFMCLWFKRIWRITAFSFAGLGIIAISSYVTLHYFNIWMISIAPAFAWVMSLIFMFAFLSHQERNQRSVLMQLFSKHVSKDVAEVIWQEREQYLNAGRLRSQRITATVLFTDLQNFTSLSEKMEAQALMDWLNQYMETMVNVVEKKHHGQVNKFIGDAVMAVFGVPIARTTKKEMARDAINAVECALSMREELDHLREKWQAEGLPLIRMRVGIFTGELVAGSLGGVERQEYTVIGDTVNTASRLESFDKTIETDNPCRILIGEPTREYLGDRFETSCVGEVALKGKSTKITIYSVISRKNIREGSS